jgi:hypothetical protein
LPLFAGNYISGSAPFILALFNIAFISAISKYLLNFASKSIFMDASTLTQLIANKGGMVGYTAKFYVSDHRKAHQFILECSEQIHNDLAKSYWGEDLLLKLKAYAASSGKNWQHNKIEKDPL